MKMSKIKLYFKKDFATLKKNLLFAIAFAIFYGIEVYFLNQEALTGYGQYRPLIFLPALASIAFGPLVGAFVGGFGNLTNDIIRKMIIEHESLHMGHLMGFIGNFIGAYVVGVLSVDIDVKSKGLFSKESFKDYIWNTVAGFIGMGAVTGFIIGFGRLLIGKAQTIEEAILFAGTVTFWNGVFMLILLAVLPLYGYLEKVYLEKQEAKKRELVKIKIVESKDSPFSDIIEGRFIDSVPIEKEWATMGIQIKNTSDKTLRFKAEIIGPDIIQPSVKFTKKLNPGEVDEVTFSIYPLDEGERHFKIRLVPWSEDLSVTKELTSEVKEGEYELAYKAMAEESEKLSSLTSIIGLLVIFGLLAKTFYEILSSGSISMGLSIALSLFIAEIVLVFAWYMWKKMKLSSQ